MTREEIQKEAKNKWLKTTNGTLVIGTGGGKSKIAIDLIDEVLLKLPNSKFLSALILVNSTSLRDKNWNEEIEKFGLKSDVTIATYQTAYKWKDRTFDMVVFDEVDFACTPEYQQVFKDECIKSTHKLALTGFLPKEKEDLLNEFNLPVLYKITTQELQDVNALNESRIILIQYPLSTANTKEVKKKDGGVFYTSENSEYAYWDKEVMKRMIIKANLEKQKRILNLSNDTSVDKSVAAADFKFKMAVAKRKAILHNSPTSIKVVQALYNKIHSKPGNKLLIFSANTKQADKLYNPFHGKNEKDFSGIEDLNEGKVNTLSVVKKINRGMNLTGVNYIIRESYDGSETDMQQIHGRGMRLKPGQVMTMIILVPYYETVTKTEGGGFKKIEVPTQAANWVKNMLQSFNTDKVETIRLDKTLTIPDGI